MEPESVLVLGNGELGNAILKSLAAERKAARLAVLTRSTNDGARRAAKSQELQKLQSYGIELVNGDVVDDSSEQLAAIFSQYHTVISANGMNLPAGSQMKISRAILLAAATRSMPKRYFPWQFGISYDEIGRGSGQNLFDEQLDVRDLLRRQSTVSWVIVSTVMFISFLFEPSFGLVSASRDSVTALGSWDNALTVTAPEDIGKITARLALLHPNVKGVVYTAGDTVTFRRLVDIVERVTGREVTRKLKTVDQLETELAEGTNDGMRKYRVVFGRGVGVSWSKADSFNGVQHIPTTSVDEWAQMKL